MGVITTESVSVDSASVYNLAGTTTSDGVIQLPQAVFCLVFSPDCVALSRDIARHDKDLDKILKRKMLDLLNLIKMPFFLS